MICMDDGIFQDLIVDDSVLYGLPEEDDMHEDMRLDVDNMSYEVINTFSYCIFRFLVVLSYYTSRWYF